MLVAIDVSNHQTVFGIYAGERLTHHWRISTNLERTTDEHGAILSTLMHSAGLEVPIRPEGVAISCSVPPLNQVMEQLVGSLLQLRAADRRPRHQNRDADSV